MSPIEKPEFNKRLLTNALLFQNQFPIYLPEFLKVVPSDESSIAGKVIGRYLKNARVGYQQGGSLMHQYLFKRWWGAQNGINAKELDECHLPQIADIQEELGEGVYRDWNRYFSIKNLRDGGLAADAFGHCVTSRFPMEPYQKEKEGTIFTGDPAEVDAFQKGLRAAVVYAAVQIFPNMDLSECQRALGNTLTPIAALTEASVVDMFCSKLI